MNTRIDETGFSELKQNIFEFTEEQQMILDLCKDFGEKELREQAVIIDRTHEFPMQTTKKLGELGLMGIVTPEKYGGAGMDYTSYALAIKELSKYCASTGTIVAAHNSLCISPIYYFGSEKQKERYLPKLCTGEHIGAFAITEPEAGSDAGGTRTTAELQNGKWLLNGSKNFITNGAVCDVHVVLAVTNRESKKGNNTSMFIVEKGTKGFSVGKTEDKLGICASSTTEMIYDNCAIPEDNILASPGDGFKIAMHTLDGGRIGVAAQALGIAQAALDAAAEYAHTRVQFNKPIAKLQAIQWMIADMATEIEAAWLLIHKTAQILDQGDRRKASRYSAMAKLYASECAHRCAHKCIQIHGGYGYVKDYIAERLYRDARITEIYEGTSEIQRLVIGNSVLSDYE